MKDFRPIWKKLVDQKFNGSVATFQHCLLRAMYNVEHMRQNHPNSTSNFGFDMLVKEALILLRKAFTPVKSPVKLANGRYPYDSLDATQERVRFNKGVLGEHIYEILDTQEERNTYLELVKACRTSEMPDMLYCYIFVRQDISMEQQLVQAAHVTYVAGQKLPESIPANSVSFVVIGVANEKALSETCADLRRHGLAYSLFVEPDMRDQITAIATEAVDFRDSRRAALAHHHLLSFGKARDAMRKVEALEAQVQNMIGDDDRDWDNDQVAA